MSKRDVVPGLGERLKAARGAADLTQVQAAETSGVARVNISKFESDLTTPTLATLYKLAEAYGVNVCDLLPGGLYDGKRVPASPGPPTASPTKKPKGKK